LFKGEIIIPPNRKYNNVYLLKPLVCEIVVISIFTQCSTIRRPSPTSIENNLEHHSIIQKDMNDL
jgi:hypothetical protein